MIKAIVFDYAGVLIKPPLFTWLNENIRDEKQRSEAAKAISTKGDLGEVTLDELFHLVANYTGLVKENVFSTIYSPAKENADLFSLIKKLKRKYTIAIFSNNHHELICEVLKYKKYYDYFDELVVSSTYKLLKPNKSFYIKLMEILQVQPEEVIFFDDKKENVDAAKKLGIKAFVYTTVKQLKQDLLYESIHV